MLGVGDLILEESQGDFYLSLVKPVLKASDVVVGHGEVLFTSRGVNTFVEMWAPAHGCPPSNMGAIASANFNVITLAGNHTFDSGAPGIEDTIAGFQSYGIAVTGAGMNIDEARKPAVIERKGTRFGFLSYNCVGPIGSWAFADKPGCAYVRVITHYEAGILSPGGLPTIYTFAEPVSLNAMISDIQKLRPLCDVLVVALHKGILREATRLAMYDKQVSHAAIDAGADIVFGHHAHIVKGIELYKGKVIFHGLGHFVMAMLPQTKGQTSRMSELSSIFGKEFPNADPADFLLDGEGSWTIIAKCTIDGNKIVRVSYLPCLINRQKQPEILKNDERGQQVFNFVDKITKAAGLDTVYEWKGDEVVIQV